MEGHCYWNADVTVETSNEEKAEEDCIPFTKRDFIRWTISKIAIYICEKTYVFYFCDSVF
jgi:hypothetical protein